MTDQQSVVLPLRVSVRAGFMYPDPLLMNQMLMEQPKLEGMLGPRVQEIVIESA